MNHEWKVDDVAIVANNRFLPKGTEVTVTGIVKGPPRLCLVKEASGFESWYHPDELSPPPVTLPEPVEKGNYFMCTINRDDEVKWIPPAACVEPQTIIEIVDDASAFSEVEFEWRGMRVKEKTWYYPSDGKHVGDTRIMRRAALPDPMHSLPPKNSVFSGFN